MKKIALSLLALASFLFASQALAHVSYRSLDVSNPFQRSVTSNVGWADAAEANWGDSHHGAWFSFSLAQDSLVSLQVTGLAQGTYPTLRADGQALTNSGAPSNPYTTVANLSDVGFSLYKGLFPASAYEGANSGGVPYINFSAQGKEGGWNALGDTTLYNNSGAFATLDFITAVNTSSGNTETLINFFLTAGNYSIGAGGAINPALGDHDGTYGIQAQLLNVQPVPVPAAAWLFGSAIAGLIGVGKRKRSIV